MKWPWLSRALHDEIIEAIDKFYLRRLDSLERELDYWREKFEKEQARADRAVDSLISQNGQTPISEESRSERSKVADAMVEMQHQIGEIFGDVESSLTSAENDPSTQVVGEETKPPTKEELEEDKKRRLAEIKARIDARNAEKTSTSSTNVTASA